MTPPAATTAIAQLLLLLRTSVSPMQALVQVVADRVGGGAMVVHLDPDRGARLGPVVRIPDAAALAAVATVIEGGVPSWSGGACLPVSEVHEDADERTVGWLLTDRPAGDDVAAVLPTLVDMAALTQQQVDRADDLAMTSLMAEAATEARRDQLDVAHQLVDGVGAVLGHEVRDSLRSLMGWTRLALTVDIGEEVRWEMLRRIQRAVEQATASVGDVLETIHEAQADRDEELVVDLNGVVHWVSEALADQIRARRAHVLSDQLPAVVASPTLLRLALLELVRNSLDHGGQFVQVYVRAQIADGMLEIRVYDNGPGIQAAEPDEVFAAGYSTGVGTGYGLTRVREAVQEHGGVVLFETSPEWATVAVVRLPHLAQMTSDVDLDVER